MIDLHVHTTASDGTDSARALVEKAAALGLSAISITDHDGTGALAEAAEAGAALGVEVVPGVELSADYLDGDIHILGYFIDPDCEAMRRTEERTKLWRRERNERIVQNLAAAGYDISLAELHDEYPESELGRLHFCDHLVKKGCFPDRASCFHTLLARGKPFYLEKRRLSPEEAASVILEAGGVPVLAHPLLYGLDWDGLLDLCDEIKDYGIRHLEAYYSEFSPDERAQLLALAGGLGFGVTGGSDYHGENKPHIALGTGCGDLAVGEWVLERLRLAATKGKG